MDWLTSFMEDDRPDSCSCSKDCDHERTAARKEIRRLRSELLKLERKERDRLASERRF